MRTNKLKGAHKAVFTEGELHRLDLIVAKLNDAYHAMDFAITELDEVGSYERSTGNEAHPPTHRIAVAAAKSLLVLRRRLFRLSGLIDSTKRDYLERVPVTAIAEGHPRAPRSWHGE